MQAGRRSCGIPLGRYSSCYVVLPEGLNFLYVYNLHINSVASRLSWEIVYQPLAQSIWKLLGRSVLHFVTQKQQSWTVIPSPYVLLGSHTHGAVSEGQGAEVLPCVVELRGCSFSMIGFTHGTLEIKCTFPLYSILQKFTLHLLQKFTLLLCKYIK